MSRGAREVVFIERATGAVKVIRENLRSLGAVGSEIYKGKVGDYNTEKKFEIILADPPYDDFDATEVAGLVKYLQLSGVLVLSHPGEAPELAGLTLEKSRKYAGATLSVYHF